jgi:hypothetical protein
MIKKRAALATLVAGAVLFISQPTFGALPPVSTSPTFSLDFSDSSKVSGTTWTDQVAGVSASAIGTQYSTEQGGSETFTANASYLDFGKPALGSALNPSGNISGEVWIKFNTFNANWNVFLTKWFDDLPGNAASSDYHLSVYTDGTSPRQLNLYTTGKSDLRGSTTIALNQWYHFVFTIDNTSATKKICLYVNGNLDATYTSASSVRTANTNNKLFIGDARNITGPNAVIARVRLYNKALTASEVSGNYSADLADFAPTVNISLAASNGVYRISQDITATSTKPGVAKFYVNNKVISGCARLPITTSVTCTWRPAIRGNLTVKVLVIPSNIAIPSKTAQASLYIANRTSKR